MEAEWRWEVGAEMGTSVIVSTTKLKLKKDLISPFIEEERRQAKMPSQYKYSMT